MAKTDLIMQNLTERVVEELRKEVFMGGCKFENIDKIDVSNNGEPVRTISGWGLRDKIREAYVENYRETRIRRAVHELFQKLDTVSDLQELVEDLQNRAG